MAPLVIADSVTNSGDRLTTVCHDLALDQIAQVHELDRVSCTWLGQYSWRTPPSKHQALITGMDLERLPGDLGRFDSTPRPVGTTEMHHPYITDDERTTLDLSIRACLSCARCNRLGKRDSIQHDIGIYQSMLRGRPTDRPGFDHCALPVDHEVFEGLGVTSGMYPGWISWREMLIYRGDPT